LEINFQLLKLGVYLIYKGFAEIYDKLMYDVNYKEWADYIENIFKKFNIAPKLIADLGCGTGSFCIEMAKRGYDMIGIDLSPEMLSYAAQKSKEEGMDILFLNQDMSEFELYGTVDAIVSLMDSVNYILTKNKLKKMFKLVKNYLNPGGIFVFDINSDYKLSNILGNNIFYEIGEDICYLWKNNYNPKNKVCEFELTFFIKEKQNGLYKRIDELHYERAYACEDIKSIAEQTGLKCLAIYNGFTFSVPQPESERIFFVCQKEIQD